MDTLGRWGGGLALIWGATHVVRSARDLPPADAGVITLPADTAWMICVHLDLQGARIVCAGICAIYGTSAETASLTSTGLTGAPLLAASETLQLRTLSLAMPAGEVCVSVAGDGVTTALDWHLVNFTGDGRALNANNVNNFLGDSLALLSGDGFYFTGTVNTVAMVDSIFLPPSGLSAVDVTGATVNRRLRLTNCAGVVTGGAQGVRVDAANIALPEGCQIDTCNFSGGGTYVTPLTYLSDKARWIECRGITNTARIGELYWTGNATATVNPGAGIFAKVAGVSTPDPNNQRFGHSDNRLTYVSALTVSFIITAVCTITAANNNQVTVAMYKDGAEIPGSSQTVTTNAAGRAENITIQTTTTLAEAQYIETWVANNTTADVTVTVLNMIVRSI